MYCIFDISHQFANQHSIGRPITFDFVAEHCSLSVRLPQTIAELKRFEDTFDVMDIYLWMSYRFTDMYPHRDRIRTSQSQLDGLIQNALQSRWINFWLP